VSRCALEHDRFVGYCATSRRTASSRGLVRGNPNALSRDRLTRILMALGLTIVAADKSDRAWLARLSWRTVALGLNFGVGVAYHAAGVVPRGRVCNVG
jgi:hypothetical protein